MTQDTVRLVAFVLALVGGLLGFVEGLRPALRNPLSGDLDIILLLLGGAVATIGALRGWKGPARDGGVLAVVGGVVLLLGGATTPGVLALVGGILFVVK